LPALHHGQNAVSPCPHGSRSLFESYAVEQNFGRPDAQEAWRLSVQIPVKFELANNIKIAKLAEMKRFRAAVIEKV
jgi:hypothetical protein